MQHAGRQCCRGRLRAPRRDGPPPPPSPLALVAVRFGFAVALFAGRLIIGQPFGLFGFHFRFDFDVERLVLVKRLFSLRREGRNLRCEQRLSRLQRMHLFAAIDDERLLAADGRVSDYGKRHLEAVLEIRADGRACD